jgi:hypothetical protein
MADFLWHEVSEKEKADISKQAKSIMDDFSNKLSSADKLKEAEVIRKESERFEGSGIKLPLDKKTMFDNAPDKNKDFIIAEKKTW